MPRGSWGAAVVLFFAAASVAALALVGLRHAPAALFGEAEVWKAQEDGMKLSAEDDIAKQTLAASKASLVKFRRGNHADFSFGLGSNMAHLERERQQIHLKEKRYMLEAGMERARAHLERVQANDDAQIAKSDLDQVLSLDQSLAGMKKKAADDKADFKAATAQIKASHAEIAVLKQHAAKVAKQIKALRGTAAALVAKATHTREEEARAKDKADVAREQLSSALVHRARRRAALQKGRAQLVKLQKSA